MRKNFALESHFCRYPFYEWQTLQHLLNEPEKKPQRIRPASLLPLMTSLKISIPRPPVFHY